MQACRRRKWKVNYFFKVERINTNETLERKPQSKNVKSAAESWDSFAINYRNECEYILTTGTGVHGNNLARTDIKL